MKQLSIWEATYRSGFTYPVVLRFTADSIEDAVAKASRLTESGGPRQASGKPVTSVVATDERVWVVDG